MLSSDHMLCYVHMPDFYRWFGATLHPKRQRNPPLQSEKLRQKSEVIALDIFHCFHVRFFSMKNPTYEISWGISKKLNDVFKNIKRLKNSKKNSFLLHLVGAGWLLQLTPAISNWDRRKLWSQQFNHLDVVVSVT